MKLNYLAGAAVLLLSVLGTAQAATTTVKVVALNDFHGNLQSPGAISGNPVGGVDFLAGYVANLKAQNPNNVVVAAGDLMGASPLISALWHDEGTVETLNRLGLDFASIGNHEFDEGATELKRIQNGGCHPTDVNSCQGAAVGTPVPFEGAKYKYLAANVVVTATGKTLLPPYAIKVFGGVQMAFIGLTLKETPTIVTPSGVAGLSFTDEAAAVNALIPKLRARGVEAIVVLIHQGGFQGSAAPNFINDCSANLGTVANSPIKGIVANLDNAVDLVVSGHTHTGYNCSLPNKIGRNIPVTQAGAFGRFVTDINMSLDNDTGDVTAVTVNNLVVNRTVAGAAPTLNGVVVTPNATIASIVDGYNTLVSPLANAVIGTITASVGSGAGTGGQSDAGSLIADAQLLSTQPAQFGGAVVAFMNAGGVRGNGFNIGPFPHDVTYGEAFTLQPFGNSLVTVTLTAQQIKDVLEQQFAGCNGQTVTRILQVSAGFTESFSNSAPACSKIRDVTLNGTPIVSSGVVLNPATPYRVTINNFLSTGGDGFTVLLGGTNLLGGAQDIDALVAYLAGFKSPNAPYNPGAAVLAKPRVTTVP